jgi:hypothetical protein
MMLVGFFQSVSLRVPSILLSLRTADFDRPRLK